MCVWWVGELNEIVQKVRDAEDAKKENKRRVEGRLL